MILSPQILRKRLENEWKNKIEPMNRPGFLEITHAEDYEAFHVKVLAPSYVVPTVSTKEPELRMEHRFTVFVPTDYPHHPPKVFFDDPTKRIAHINVWDSGRICLSEWSENMCDIASTISKCIHAIAFDPGNWKKDSMACSKYLPFIQKLEEEGKCPVFELEKIPIPGRRISVSTKKRVMEPLKKKEGNA